MITVVILDRCVAHSRALAWCLPFSPFGPFAHSRIAPLSPALDGALDGALYCAGVSGFYDGVGPAALHSILEKFGYFYAFAVLRHWYTSGTGKMTVAANMVIGYLAEFAHLGATIPVERVFVRIQTGKDGGLVDALQCILAESGVGGLYVGWRTYFILALKPALEFTVFEQIKGLVLRRRGSKSIVLSPAEAFFLGAVARGIATLICFPATRVKTILQAKSRRTHNGKIPKRVSFKLGTPTRPSSPVNEVQNLLQEQGISALYQGIGPEITRGVLSSAMKMAVKERIFLAVRGALGGAPH
jgi:adenine nucleotide transporter 17